MENPVQILLGSSIVNAHNLENKIAHTPRIVIDDDFSKCVESNSEVFKSIDFITQDKDGIKHEEAEPDITQSHAEELELRFRKICAQYRNGCQKHINDDPDHSGLASDPAESPAVFNGIFR